MFVLTYMLSHSTLFTSGLQHYYFCFLWLPTTAYVSLSFLKIVARMQSVLVCCRDLLITILCQSNYCTVCICSSIGQCTNGSWAPKIEICCFLLPEKIQKAQFDVWVYVYYSYWHLLVIVIFNLDCCSKLLTLLCHSFVRLALTSYH